MKRTEVLDKMTNVSSYYEVFSFPANSVNRSGWGFPSERYYLSDYADPATLGTVEKKVREYVKDWDQDIVVINAMIKIEGHDKIDHLVLARKTIEGNKKTNWKQIWSVDEIVANGWKVKGI